MKFLEKDLEEIIFEASKQDFSELFNRGLYLGKFIKRQLKIGNYGIADLVSFEKEYKVAGNNKLVPYLEITVIELKKDKIGISAFLQAVGYVKGIERYFEKHHPKIIIKTNIILIGKTIDDSGNFCYIADILNNVTCYTYSYDIDGLKFKSESGYKLILENLKK